MNEERKQVLHLLETGFPRPTLPATADELRALDHKEHDRLGLELQAHQAVHDGHPEHRLHFALQLCDKLLDGDPLSVAERAWLLYVLKNAGTTVTKNKKAFPDNLPSEHTGRRPTPPIDNVATMLALGIALAESSSEKGITEQLEYAAKKMHKSYEALRKIYYSESYKHFSETDLFDRWVSPNTDIAAPLELAKQRRVKNAPPIK